MKRVILDTNIYGLIVNDPNKEIVKDGIEKKKSAVVYGFSLIRKELRDTPRKIRVEGENLRNYLLRIYDEFTTGHELKFIGYAKELADYYFITYKELGGFANRQEIIKDFIIVASASLNSLDIVISNDNKTMLSQRAVKSYNIVNRIKKIGMPRFMNYEEFKKELK